MAKKCPKCNSTNVKQWYGMMPTQSWFCQNCLNFWGKSAASTARLRKKQFAQWGPK
tara:strand:- start:47 stop:214 length:168 start_codon:yes stop_codon:yes gene_type:complete